MKASDLRTKSVDELDRELLGLRREQFNLRMQRGAGQLANPMRFAAVRKDIARIKTVLTEKTAPQVATAKPAPQNDKGVDKNIDGGIDGGIAKIGDKSGDNGNDRPKPASEQ